MPKLAVIGHPVAHSRSPAMQTAALESLGLAQDWSYEAIDIPPERFAEEIRGLAGGGYAGVNVTVPHKTAALEIADDASAAAREIGAANVLVFDGGRIQAENTDASGLVAALGGPGSAAGRRALVLGAGGSARACAWALREDGAEVSVVNRTRARAEALAAALGVGLLEGPENIDPAAWALIVNATSVGLDTANLRDLSASELEGRRATELKALGIDADGLGDGQTVVDLVYGERTTALIEAAKGKQAKTVEGIEILVAQGVDSLRIWTGADPPAAVMREAALSER